MTSTFALSTGTVVGLTPESHPLATITHRVDGQPPTVTIDSPVASAIPSGNVTLTGTASDLAPDGTAGSGVGFVYVSTDGTTWYLAKGTATWSATMYTEWYQSTLTLYVYARDNAGNPSAVVQHTFIVDRTAPQVTLNVPAVTTSTLTTVSGSTYDPAPQNALVQSVEVQVDGAISPWRTTAGPFALLVTGTQNWLWSWTTPQEDGVTHTLRARATDAAGNVTVSDWQQILVDTVAPQITVTQHVSTVLLPNDPDTRPPTSVTDPTPSTPSHRNRTRRSTSTCRWWCGALSPPRPRSRAGRPHRRHCPSRQRRRRARRCSPAPSADGADVIAVHILIYGPTGEVSTADASLSDGTWTWEPDLSGWAAGTYALRVQAVEATAMSARPARSHSTRPMCRSRACKATNDGPRASRRAVTFTATISAGSK